ncbi:MAG TPA: four helix bundle protein [Planctomycetota bacterium]
MKAWQVAYEVTLEVYRLTSAFPPMERFGLVNQMRRASVSMPSSLAEGYARRRPRDKGYFYTVARSSGEELKSQLMVSRDLGFIQPAKFEAVMIRLDEACRLMHGLIEAMETRTSSN